MAYEDFDITSLTLTSSGMDSFLGGDETESLDFSKLAAQEPKRVRVAKVADLQGFRRIADDTLIRKSERDLWSLAKTDDGDWVIERLFDDDGNPLRV